MRDTFEIAKLYLDSYLPNLTCNSLYRQAVPHTTYAESNFKLRHRSLSERIQRQHHKTVLRVDWNETARARHEDFRTSARTFV